MKKKILKEKYKSIFNKNFKNELESIIINYSKFIYD
jgi:hypothetical protein